MKALLSAWVYEHDNGDVEWTVRSHPRAEALGMASVIAGGRVHAADPDDAAGSDPADVIIACEVIGARLIRLSDSAAWSHPLF
jgi:hypothetical protein